MTSGISTGASLGLAALVIWETYSPTYEQSSGRAAVFFLIMGAYGSTPGGERFRLAGELSCQMSLNRGIGLTNFRRLLYE